MVECVQRRYLNQGLQIGLASVKEAYLLYPEPSLLLTEVYRGKLVYRAKGSGKRISYERVKQGLKKTTKVLTFSVPDWLYELSPRMSPKRKTLIKLTPDKGSKN